ncbi:MAG: hypothetical protein NTU95_05315 [Methanothrix sp.]|nr:hypothetical protein [Methanothrix sp.]
MSSAIVSAPPFPTIPILPNGRSLGGILEQAEPMGCGLVRIVISGMEYLVDDSLHATLMGVVGKKVAVCRILGQWGAGVMPS